jgi:hypothetical protein
VEDGATVLEVVEKHVERWITPERLTTKCLSEGQMASVPDNGKLGMDDSRNGR